jgi:hypothetical protein
MYHIWGRGEVYAGCERGNLKEKKGLEEPGLEGKKKKKKDL